MLTRPDPARWGEVLLNLMAFEPVVDGDVLADLPIRAVAAGSAAGVPVLAGANRDEQRLFLVPNGLIDLVDEGFLRTVVGSYGMPVEETVQAYRADRPDGTPGELFADVATDWFYRLPAVRLAEAQTGRGTPAWLYELSWPSPQFGGRLGACHALDVGFVFDTLGHESHGPMLGADAPQELADAMHGAWVRFARDGDPGWPPYDLDRRPVQDFGTAVRVADDPRGDLRALWAGVR